MSGDIKAWRAVHPERYAYRTQLNNATRRGIEFLFTFEEWVTWWGDDFARRGRGKDDLQMCRIGDVGPYVMGNVNKRTHYQNKEEQERDMKAKEGKR